jgi:hypothetical protein
VSTGGGGKRRKKREKTHLIFKISRSDELILPDLKSPECFPIVF